MGNMIDIVMKIISFQEILIRDIGDTTMIYGLWIYMRVTDVWYVRGWIMLCFDVVISIRGGCL